MALTVGVDLGGTKILTALVDEHGRIVASDLRPTDAGTRTAREVIADVAAAVASTLVGRAEPVASLGVGVAGQVDEDGNVNLGPNLGWRNVALGRELADAVGMRVAVANDVRAAAWGEWRHGAGRGVDDLITLFIGTGIGGGIISGGRMLAGHGNAAGELGHATIVAGGRKCHCPNWGCLEAYVGGWAIAERARELALANPERGVALVRLAGSVAAISAATVSEAARNGDALAREIVGSTEQFMIAGAVGMINALNPSVLILGGGVVEGMPELVGGVDRAVRDLVLPAAAAGLRIVKAELGGEAGAIGAAAFARETAEASS